MLCFLSRGTRSQGGGGHGGGVDQGLLQVRGVRLDDHRLAGDQRAGPVPCVNGGDSEAADVIDERVAAIVGVDGAKLGLERRGFLQLLLIMRLVQDARKADDGVGVDKSGSDHLGFENARAGGDYDRGRIADGLNLAVFDQHDTVTNGLACHRVNGFALNGDVLRKCRRGEQAHNGSEM